MVFSETGDTVMCAADAIMPVCEKELSISPAGCWSGGEAEEAPSKLLSHYVCSIFRLFGGCGMCGFLLTLSFVLL